MSLDPQKLKVGEIIARIIYAQVLNPHAERDSFQRLHAVRLRDLQDHTEFYIEGDELLKCMTSADQFTQEESASLTEVIEVFIHAEAQPFTVCFVKQDGSERTLRGIMTEVEPLLGRSTVVDFEVTKGTPLRQVDHRTVKWLILDGVKYTVRKK